MALFSWTALSRIETKNHGVMWFRLKEPVIELWWCMLMVVHVDGDLLKLVSVYEVASIC